MFFHCKPKKSSFSADSIDDLLSFLKTQVRAALWISPLPTATAYCYLLLLSMQAPPLRIRGI